MLVSFLDRKLNELASTWDEKRAHLQTAMDVQKRNESVRENLLTMLGAFPRRSPLTATTVRVAEKDGYQAENVLFCSRPEFWVTGNLYVPTTGNGPFPAVICSSINERVVHGIPTTAEELADIRAVHAGKKTLSPQASYELAEHATDDALTKAEIDVLRLIAAGNANKQIADLLSVTEETVKGRVKNILAKLNANDRTHAATIGLKRGIIEL